jgi:uncharacterized protein
MCGDFWWSMDLSIPQIVFLAAMIFLAGFVDSIAGGGGLISLPAYFAVGLPPHAALATNKFSGFCGTATAVIRYWRAGVIHLRIGLVAAAGALAGSALGAKIALWISGTVINAVMLLCVPAVLVIFLFKDQLFPKTEVVAKVTRPIFRAAIIGAIIGCYDGFFGPGTGTFLAIAFAFFMRYDLVTASGNARLANLASNAGSLAVFLINGKALFPLAFITAASGIAGNVLGSHFALHGRERIIRPIMTAVLVLLLIEVIRRQVA